MNTSTETGTGVQNAAGNERARTRYAAVGTGGRIRMFIDPLARDYVEHGELVGLCDVSQTRMTYHQQRLQNEFGYRELPTYLPEQFEQMLQETRAEVVIVCSIDSTHHEYIIRALRAGCDVVTEKPMTTDGEKCAAVFEAVRETGRKVRVTFNARWGPGPTKVRELLQSGVIGTVHAVNMEYQLNTSHGADYFRRWHAHKEFSGGLLIHKSTHHFDLINWWTNSIPTEVFAWGKLNFYGRENAIRRGDERFTGYDRYTDVPEAQEDPFAFTLDEGAGTQLYRNAEEETGYIRDRNVFREGISIEDTMSLLVKYRTGIVLNYSLVAFSPQEGYRVTFTGDRGRIEYSEERSSHVIRTEEEEKQRAKQNIADEGARKTLRVLPMFSEAYEVPIEEIEGGHGGADPLIQRQIFDPGAPEENLGRNAGHEQGAASLLIGAAANRSMETGLPVQIDDLCPLPKSAVHLGDLI